MPTSRSSLRIALPFLALTTALEARARRAACVLVAVVSIGLSEQVASGQTSGRPAVPRPAPQAQRPPTAPVVPANEPGGTRDAAGRVVEVTSPLGRPTRFEYVGQTQTLKAIVHPDGTRQEFEYDARGRLLVERAGGIVISTFTYLPDGKIASYRQAGESETRLAYTADGRVKSQTNALGHTTELEYDARGNLIRETDPLRGVTLRTYDARNQLTSVTTPAGGVTRYQYDAGGRLSQHTDEVGGVTRYEHNDRGQLVAETNAAGGRTQYEYDAAGQIAQVVFPDGTNEAYKYDTFGQLIEQTDVRGFTQQHEYDGRGRRVRTRAGGSEITFDHDRSGRLIASTSSAGGTRRFEIDDFDRIVSEADAAGATTRYRWDASGNIVAIVDPRGRERQLSYTANGQLASVREPTGDESRLIYDAAGRITAIQRPSGGVANLEWDAAGRLIAVADPTRLARRYAYDASGRRVSETDPTGRSQRFSYDAAGRVVSTEAPGAAKTTFAYDAQHRLVSADDGVFPMRWSYNAGGRATSTEYVWLKKAIRSELDALGRRSRLIDTDGRAIEYSYAPSGHLSGLVLPQGGRIDFTYDASGGLQRVTYPNGVVGEWTYDRAGQPLSITYRRASQILRRIEYTYDAAGDPLLKRDSQSGETTYAYDAVGQLTEEAAGQTRTSYRYASGGNRSARESSTGVTSYRYDPADRVVSAGTATFAYDGNGYLTQRSDADGATQFEMNSEGRLAGLRLPAGRQVSLQYGPTGERVARVDSSVDGGRRRYFLHDGFNLVQQLDADGRTLTLFVHGLDMDRPFAAIRGTDVFFLHPDRLGSLVLVTDARGTAAASLDYDAFGNERSLLPNARLAAGVEDAISVFGFAGREREGLSTGLYNNRARHYAPALGRFLTADRLVSVDEPGELNPFLYVRNRPTRLTDPLGLRGQWRWWLGPGQYGPPIPPTFLPGEHVLNPNWLKLLGSDELLDELKNNREELAKVAKAGNNEPYKQNLKGNIERIRTLLQDRGVRVPSPNDTLSGARREGAARGRTNTLTGESGGNGPRLRTGQVAAPAGSPAARGPEVPAPGAGAPTPNRPSIWSRNANSLILVAVSAAMMAQCYSETRNGTECVMRFAPGFVVGGLIAGAQYALVLSGHTVLATFVTGVSIGASVIITGVAVYAAYGEYQRAFAAMNEADRNTLLALEGLKQRLERLKLVRADAVNADSTANFGLQDTETKRAKADRDLSAVETAVAGFPAIPAQCQEAGRLQQQLRTARQEIDTRLQSLLSLTASGRAASGTCRTLGDARDLDVTHDRAARALEEIGTLGDEADAARKQLTPLLTGLSRGRQTGSPAAANSQLNDAIASIGAAEAAIQALQSALPYASTTLSRYTTELFEITRDLGQIEQNYLNLSRQEWVVALLSTRIDLRNEFTAVRSMLKAHEEPTGIRVNTEGFKQRVDTVKLGNTSGDGRPNLIELRARAKAAGEKILGTSCNAADEADAVEAIRQTLASASRQQADVDNLAVYAAQCREAAQRNSSTTPTVPTTPTAPATPTQGTGNRNPPGSVEQPGNPPGPGTTTTPPTGGVQFTPGPPPVLAASLGCGPIIEIFPGQNSTTCSITVTGWRSDTTTPVEVIVGPLSSSVQASPGDTSQAGDTMYAAGVSNRFAQYIFGEGFSAPRGAPPSSQTIMINVRQRGHGLVRLPLTINVLPVGAPPGSTISPPQPNIPGSGGPFCVWQYKLIGDRPECWNFVAAVCTSTRYAGRAEYIQVGNNMTWGQADARIGELSSYFNDAYGCRAIVDRPSAPPPPPAVVTTGSGGIYSVWRYKLIGDLPQCFHFVAAPNGKFGPPSYELVGANMLQSEADARIQELSRYFDDAMGCRAGPATPPRPPPTTTTPATPNPNVPVTPPVTPPGPVLGPAARSLGRFGIVPATITVNVGEAVQLRALGVWADSPSTVVDLSLEVRWTGQKPQSFTAAAADAGQSFVVTATAMDGSTTSATVTVSPATTMPQSPTGNVSPQTPGSNVPSLLGGSTTRTDPGTIASGGRGNPLDTPPPPPPPPPTTGSAGGTGGGNNPGSTASGPTAVAPCDAAEQAKFARMTGKWQQRLGPEVVIGGSCDAVTGTHATTDFCENPNATYNQTLKRHRKTFTGRAGNFVWTRVTPPANSGDPMTGQASCNADGGTLSCSGFGCGPTGAVKQ